jgi:TRAP-type C4-dicarboxylate transport system permease small subunit
MNPGDIIDDLDGTGYTDLNQLIIDGLNLLIGAAAVICVAVLIFSGYMYITASGDEAKIEKATKSLTYAIVGLAIAFISVLLVNFVIDDLLNPGTALLTTVLLA